MYNIFFVSWRKKRMEDKISLLELQEMIKKGVERSVPGQIWITAEISEINQNVSGHCYLDLVDYRQGERGIAAKARGMIWSSVNRVLKPYFETTAGAPLSVGMRVLLKVQVQYSQVYGLSLGISDIDPSYTLGEFELKRQQTIRRLKAEGCFDLNSQLELPLLPRRLAIVSSVTAAGYRDFTRHLEENEYGFGFYTRLFQAQMQGEEAPRSIIEALDQIAQVQEQEKAFDAVILIRGGGSVTDLACFDDYDLACNLAQFPLPVITGVGHDHDFHVCDMVAHTGLKTPTAVADFIIDIFMQEAMRLESLLQRISRVMTLRISRENSALDLLINRLQSAAQGKVREEVRRLDVAEARLKAADPADILSRGFALALMEGRKVSGIADVKEGGMTLVLQDGQVEFIIARVVKKIKKNS